MGAKVLDHPDEELVTLTVGARRLDVDRAKVRRLVRDGELQAFVDPLDKRRRLVRVVELDALRQPRPIGAEKEVGSLTAA